MLNGAPHPTKTDLAQQAEYGMLADADDLELESRLLGRNQAMDDVREQIRAAAKHSYSVLITGETGVGKELVAQAIHRLSARTNGPLVAVNCGGLPENLCVAEFFGAQPGAYTGAQNRRAGYFEQANGGTLFLDEIGDLTRELQTMFLRVLENGTFYRLGAVKPSVVDVRIIAATNHNLESAMRERRFRADLFERLAFTRIHVPPLRDRLEDLNDLVPHFINHFRNENGSSAPPPETTAEAIEILKQYSWPRNVRQLRHFVGDLLVNSSSARVNLQTLRVRLRRLQQDADPNLPASGAAPPAYGNARASASASSTDEDRLDRQFDACANALIQSRLSHMPPRQLLENLQKRVEKKVLQTVLNEFGGNKMKTADAFDWHRNTLRERIVRLGLDRNDR